MPVLRTPGWLTNPADANRRLGARRVVANTTPVRGNTSSTLLTTAAAAHTQRLYGLDNHPK